MIFLTDIKDGVLAVDQAISRLCRKHIEKVILVTNKVDDATHKDKLNEFYQLGFGKPLEVSSLHNRGINTLLDRCIEGFQPSQESVDENMLKIALVGRTNVGKSSLLNQIFNDEKVIVSDVAGTTRDAAHFYFLEGDRRYEFIDTAGVRKKSKLKGRVPFFSSVRTDKAIDDAHLVVVILDAGCGVSQQDKSLLNKVMNAYKSMIIFVNKVDLLEESSFIEKDFVRMILNAVPQCEHYPIIFGSAKTGDGIKKLFKRIPELFEKIGERISTSQLNQFHKEVIQRFPAPAKYGKSVKIYYMTQVDTLPPTFVCFINYEKYLSQDYRRFLEKRIRSYLGGFDGHTIHLKFKEREKKELKKD